MKVLAVILAGGKRKELMPLVDDRCKAAVPFFGKFRVIDFILSNCLNSGIRQVNVIVQHRFSSLQKHLRDGWNVYSTSVGEYIDVYPPQQRMGESFYSGNADSVYQNLFSIENENPDYVLTLSGDHIYKMDYRELVQYHIEKKADMTVASVPIPAGKAKSYGVMKVNSENRVVHFEEMPDEFDESCDDRCFASMGLYVFSTQVLIDAFRDHRGKTPLEFGRDILPKLVLEKKVYAYPFVTQDGKPKYWNFLRTLDDYYNGNIDILNGRCEINLFDPEWTFRTYQSQSPPTRILSSGVNENLITNSAVSSGGVVAGKVSNSILGTSVRVEAGAEVSNSILFDGVKVGKGARVNNAILEKGILVPENYSLDGNNFDKSIDHIIRSNNIVVVGKKAKLI